MLRSIAIKVLLLGCATLTCVCIPSCGGNENSQPTAAEVQDDAKKTQERQDLIKQQYQNKAAAPAK